MPVLPEEQRTLGQRHALLGQVLNNSVNYVVAGAMMMLFANDVLHLSAQRIGGILAFFPLLAMAGLPLLRVIRRFSKVHTVIAGNAVRLGVVVALLLLPAERLSYPLYLMLLLLFQGANHLTFGVVWQPLLRDITTREDRGRFFGRMRFSFSTVTLAVTAAVPLLVGNEITESQYKLLLLLPVIGILNHTYWIKGIPEVCEKEKHGAKEGTRGRLWHAFKTSPLLRRPLLIGALFLVPVFPLYVIYLKQLLHFPSTIVTAYLFCPTLGAAGSLLLWGKVTDRVGFRATLTGLLWVSIAILPLQLFILPLAKDATGWTGLTQREWLTLALLFVHGVVAGVTTAGLGIANTSMQHFHVNSRDSLEAMNLYQVAMMLVSAAIALLTGFWLDTVALPAGDTYLLDGRLHFDWVKGYFFLVGLPVQVALLILLRRLPDHRPDANVADFFLAITPLAMRQVLLRVGNRRQDEEPADQS